jgi:hypothetical protein
MGADSHHQAGARRSRMYHPLLGLPLQVAVTNTATSAITICASQNPTATIDRGGYFSVGTAYSAGPGVCRIIAAGAIEVFFGVGTDSFMRTGGGWPVGSVPALVQQTYLMVVDPAASGSDFIVCEVR